MVHRLEISTRPTLSDPRGTSIAATVRAFLGSPIVRVRTRDVHRIEADLSEVDARRVLHEFVDPVSQHGALGRLDDGPFDLAEVGRSDAEAGQLARRQGRFCACAMPSSTRASK